jgi:hypothetical protein
MSGAGKSARLIEQDWPEFGAAAQAPTVSAEELQQRINALRTAMAAQGLSHVLVYGDREHFANLTYLTHFDPRFEEALLIVGSEREPLLLVGNECAGYLGVSPLYRARRLRAERFQPLSLLNQPRDASRLLREILADEGIGSATRVGCIGWKYFGEHEHPDAEHAIDLPSYMVDTLRALVGYEAAVNATAVLMHPARGLRTRCSASEVAYFEYSNGRSAQGMKSMLHGLRPGMRDYELARLVGYNGEPLSCHMTLVTEANRELGLSGPVGARIERGSPLASNFGYWGSNICRAGWVADSARDLSPPARDYVEQFAAPYFEAMVEWFRLLRIGTRGGALSALISARLPFERFHIFLNAGHLTHLDEWVSSPIYPDSEIPLHSGMALQVDVIPSSPLYFSTRMEDGVVLADAQLRARLAELYPECYARCQRRRDFMIEQLGMELGEEVLPLSNTVSIVPPFLLRPNQFFAMR